MPTRTTGVAIIRKATWKPSPTKREPDVCTTKPSTISVYIPGNHSLISYENCRFWAELFLAEGFLQTRKREMLDQTTDDVTQHDFAMCGRFDEV